MATSFASPEPDMTIQTTNPSLQMLNGEYYVRLENDIFFMVDKNEQFALIWTIDSTVTIPGPPTITLLGPNPIIHETTHPFTDPGATAFDVEDGDITESIVVTGLDNLSTPGLDTLTYSVTDSDGHAFQTTRIVKKVHDTLPPVISLNGPRITIITNASDYVATTASAIDAIYGDLTDSIVVSGEVDTDADGFYPVVYTCIDPSGNISRITQTFIVTTYLDGTANVFLNQIGYFTTQNKSAVITDCIPERFSIINPISDSVVFSGIPETGNSEPSGKSTYYADFSSFKENGDFFLTVNDSIRSYLFNINDSCYSEPLKAALKSYYYQRCSLSLPEKFAGKWSRLGGHADTSCLFHQESTGRTGSISSPGGWYDAGDYGKYMVNAGVTVGTLLSANEMFSTLEIDNLGIPESGNHRSDLLDEVRYEIEWMKTMQDSDGGVFHKLTTASFAPFVMPNEAIDQRYIIGKSTSATYNFAATMAMAARLCVDSSFSTDCLTRAKHAWEWAADNPSVDFSNPPDIATGEYSGCDIEAVKIWAAAELYLATDDDVYKQAMGDLSSLEIPVSWANERTLAFFSLVQSSTSLTEVAGKAIVDYADLLGDPVNMTAFRSPLTEFTWGSNGQCCNYAMVFAYAYFCTNDRKYLDWATGTMDYIFGKNPSGKCFITGFGSNSPQQPHHRICAADSIREPIPGFLVGGANGDKSDRLDYPSSWDESRCYLDTVESFATNEVAINWNAPLVFMLMFINNYCGRGTTKAYCPQHSIHSEKTSTGFDYTLTNHHLRIATDFKVGQQYAISLYDLLGRRIVSCSAICRSDNELLDIILDKIVHQGLILIKLTTRDKIAVEKILIR
ncbi:MAG: glycoside hydrolase family 9 protein [Chitinispirillaceae bacterium]|nr:glycoside hydrolase family 9 protein [Chitinispirillaceae bacterium]